MVVACLEVVLLMPQCDRGASHWLANIQIGETCTIQLNFEYMESIQMQVLHLYIEQYTENGQNETI